MKPRLMLLLIACLWISLWGYQWIPIGGDGHEIYSYCPSVVGLYQHILGCENGLLLYNGEEWEQVETSLPVWDVLPFDASHVIFIQGCGSYSDGVWLMNLNTHEITVLEWFIFPRFLVYDAQQLGWYLGTDEGLYFSSDGSSWTEQTFFASMECNDMVMHENHYIVSVDNAANHVYLSDDYGLTWEGTANYTLPLKDMEFGYDGVAWGIFPGFSNSSGLWKSEDFGANWEVAAWSDDANCVCIAPGGSVFMGWESSGVAKYHDNNLNFMNNGLPCLNINRLYVNPAMSIMHVMALTDSGVYMLTDFVSTDPPVTPAYQTWMQNYPNPFNPSTKIMFSLTANDAEDAKIEIFNARGQKVRELGIDLSPRTELRDLSCSVTWDGTDAAGRAVASGVYFARLMSRGMHLAQKKMLLLK
ncbi:MAG: hypothetical protein J7K89_04820 [Candidatus Cloacimonetes bacterium]|nr:hypothetical protein [Candidatus Cloacimonadota bacterium]